MSLPGQKRSASRGPATPCRRSQREVVIWVPEVAEQPSCPAFSSDWGLPKATPLQICAGACPLAARCSNCRRRECPGHGGSGSDRVRTACVRACVAQRKSSRRVACSTGVRKCQEARAHLGGSPVHAHLPQCLPPIVLVLQCRDPALQPAKSGHVLAEPGA